PWQTFVHVTLPLLRPAFLVVLIFRTLDAVRVFDLVYVLTGGGPGTATEPISLYAFTTLFADLRFGRGAALSVIVFLLAFGLALAVLSRPRHAVCVRPRPPALPRPRARARRHAGRGHVPADRDRVAAVLALAHARPHRHLPGAGVAVPHVRHAAHRLAPGRHV